ncbi:hypothetical protein [Gallaecimonas xiamenensis]|uniref:Uncharacterized protein n=1 Tax=Gallaecimonas xiamenensis 3-C-1 TaxID=745411 RepID=K2JY47_9GAMM|nr:hypothetical protein [Gallaecimonas xiamenensis]EKE75214.1 hypothetical protein B3C1_08056 [Gallaecimonas xiamenensis 3-C-1]
MSVKLEIIITSTAIASGSHINVVKNKLTQGDAMEEAFHMALSMELHEAIKRASAVVQQAANQTEQKLQEKHHVH